MTSPQRHPLVLDDVEAAVDLILARVGRRVAVGVPLGLGNPVALVNALYRRAKADPTIHLKLLTALSLEKPRGESELERAFLAPFVERVWGDCPDADYVAALREGSLPPNVEVIEFFFRPGSQLDNAHAQQHYISSNYTHAARDVFNQGCNVAAQLVVPSADGTRYSLSCNPDTSPELVARLRESGRPHVVVGLVNRRLPYMGHDAEVAPAMFDAVVDHPRYSTTLFSTPKLAVGTADYWIGLHASSLVADGGTLQVGIGALGDAVVHSLVLRQKQNALYRGLLRSAGLVDFAETAPFGQGLYGASEMLVDGFLHLRRAGILKREVYDFWALQQLVNDGRCDPARLTPAVLEDLASLGVRVLRGADFDVLQRHGVFTDDTRYEDGHVIAPDGTRAIANLADPRSRSVLARCLSPALRNGILLHAAFFLGPRDFYEALRESPADERDRICMTGVDKVNQLDRNPRLYIAQRRRARFVNSGIMVTLGGAVCSDGLDDGRVISGVGGQFNFVDMAHHLPDARSILLIRAVREREGAAPTSNVVHRYGHTTIPRHLRDIVVTEYGVADLRSKTDAEVAKALIAVADARFQDELRAAAQKACKIERGWRVPDAWRANTPRRLEDQLAAARKAGHFPAFPLGTDFTPEEQRLGRALKAVKARVAQGAVSALLQALRAPAATPSDLPHLRLLGLEAPASMRLRVARRLLLLELRSAH